MTYLVERLKVDLEQAAKACIVRELSLVDIITCIKNAYAEARNFNGCSNMYNTEEETISALIIVLKEEGKQNESK